MAELHETLTAASAFLFKDEAMTPIFCKPKLLPLKTITAQKLDAMQKEVKLRARAEELSLRFNNTEKCMAIHKLVAKTQQNS
ncbi:hypothetical protein DICVIV_11139 [Dictyocaulus viviparus]|uniref:BBSome-interacting protein 1 n=1 Tax=Dictyocaulus viviparus TaxID=29172 RepID=A0A0D8XGM0_DICVI|nr:hypothetical protein DICVIV_11139 [Dictyocaulus viviparus]